MVCFYISNNFNNKINKAAYKKTIYGHTHHIKIKSFVGNSCLFESLYSGKVAETKKYKTLIDSLQIY